MKCKHCGSNEIIKWGTVKTKTGRKQRYRCKACGRTSYGVKESSTMKTGFKCPKCGGEMEFRRESSTVDYIIGSCLFLVCPKCGYKVYVQPK
jgi:DNA-directed RNA polymerase subunit RPC12/RpoP